MFCVFPILFEGLILQNRTMNIFHNLALKNVYEKSFVMLRIAHVFAPQTYLKSLDFFRFTKKPFVSLRDTHAFAPQTHFAIYCCPASQAMHFNINHKLFFLRFSP